MTQSDKKSVVKQVLLWSAKMALVVVFTCVGLVIAGFIIYKGYDYLEKLSERPLGEVKTLEFDRKDSLGIEGNIAMKFHDGVSQMKLSFEGYPSFFNSPKNRNNQLIFKFLDKDGFEIHTLSKQLNEITKVVSDKTLQPKGGSAQESISISADLYKRIERVSVAWTIEIETAQVTKDKPPPKASPKRETQPSQKPAQATSKPVLDDRDHCGLNLSRDLRLMILGTKGAVRQTGYNTYTAGSHSITFLGSGNEIVSCW